VGLCYQVLLLANGISQVVICNMQFAKGKKNGGTEVPPLLLAKDLGQYR